MNHVELYCLLGKGYGLEVSICFALEVFLVKRCQADGNGEQPLSTWDLEQPQPVSDNNAE